MDNYISYEKTNNIVIKISKLWKQFNSDGNIEYSEDYTLLLRLYYANIINLSMHHFRNNQLSYHVLLYKVCTIANKHNRILFDQLI